MPEPIAQQLDNQKTPPGGGLANIYGDGKAIDASQEREVLKLTSGNILDERVEDDDTRVVSSQKLAEVFEASSSFTLPPVSDLFEKVATLFAGKRES